MVDWKDKEASKLGFDYVKREIVKCLGALCYKDKDIQDEVRGREGGKMALTDTAGYCLQTRSVLWEA
jgi:hypothetical protein